MKVSVIIPVKNRATLLTVTLNCILAQSKKPYEIIVVDDASTDDLASVIDTYKDKIIFLSSSGKGPGAARNTGLRMATGDAIQFFDSDDLLTINKLEVQASLLEVHNADFVYGPWVKATDESSTWKQVDVIMQYYPLGNGTFADYVLKGWCNITQSVLFRRSFVDRVGEWREDLTTYEDYEYWSRIAKLQPKMVHENKTCVIYRQHQNQITDKDVPNQARWMDGIKAMEYIRNGIIHNASTKSLLLFNGRDAASKFSYIRKFCDDSYLQVSAIERIYMLYYKVSSKLTRVKGTSWQRMHGVSQSANAFSNYLQLLCDSNIKI